MAPRERIMLDMTTVAAKRLILVGRPATGSRGRDDASIRRYRLARLKVEGRAHADEGSGRPGDPAHLHLKRVYD